MSSSANGIARMAPAAFAGLQYVDPLAKPTERCWTQLKSQRVAGYQVFLPSSSSPSQRDAYFIAEGELPREEIERCVPRAFKGLGLEIRPAGDLVAFKSASGTTYAAWRGRFLVLGSERQVTEALRTPTRDTAARWRALTGQLPASAWTWVLRVDPRVTNFSGLLGPPTTDYMFSIDTVEPQPHAVMKGRFVAHDATPAMAAKGAAWIKAWSARGEFPFAIPPPPNTVDLYNRMARTIAKLKLKQDGNRIELDWDSDRRRRAHVLVPPVRR